jgi:hypothetical protein
MFPLPVPESPVLALKNAAEALRTGGETKESHFGILRNPISESYKVSKISIF